MLPEIFKRVKPATVAIGARIDGTPAVIGTGFNVDPSGIVVTCKHVVEGFLLSHKKFPKYPIPPGKKFGRTIVKTLETFAIFTKVKGDEIEIEGISPFFIGGPHARDVAIMKLPPSDNPYPYVNLADSDQVQEGDAVATCGFPLGLAIDQGAISGTSSFQAGIISAVLPHQEVPKHLRIALQLDMTVNPGNSGGPLFLRSSGEVIGIISARLRDPLDVLSENQNAQQESDSKIARVLVPTGLSYAVPINLIKNWVDRLRHMTKKDLETLQTGELPAGWDSM
jgi:S1-C subfamily serine protease